MVWILPLSDGLVNWELCGFLCWKYMVDLW